MKSAAAALLIVSASSALAHPASASPALGDPVSARPVSSHAACPSVGEWLEPGSSKAVSAENAIANLAAADVILLGEHHGFPDIQLWQATTAALIAVKRGDVQYAYEMFPRSSQPALDAWSRGETSRHDFLLAANWPGVWGFAVDSYDPIIRLPRLQNAPAIALNVDRALIRRVGREGWAAVPPAERLGVGDPAPALPAYRAHLLKVLTMRAGDGALGAKGGDDKAGVGKETPSHGEKHSQRAPAPGGEKHGKAQRHPHGDAKHAHGDTQSHGDAAKAPHKNGAMQAPQGDGAMPVQDDGAKHAHGDSAKRVHGEGRSQVMTDRFIEAQLLWDRAFAEAIAAARKAQPDRPVIAFMGRGHVDYGHGVKHQLADLGITSVAMAVPVLNGDDCHLEADAAGRPVADLVYGLPPLQDEPEPAPRPKIGVYIANAEGGGASITRVSPDSPAEAAGFKAGDVVNLVAGQAIATAADLGRAIRAHAWGAWLPFAITREGKAVELLVKLPNGPPS